LANLTHLDRVLVVEDEALIMLDIEATLLDAGVKQVATATSVEEALRAIDSDSLDGAVLDLHLGRSGWSYDVARRLQQKGVPFVFSSGTVEAADGFRDVPLVIKPFLAEQLIAGLLQVTADRSDVAAQ
jgi:CheY-like chemotaxis protein